MSPLTEPTKLTLRKGFTWNETVWNPSMIQTALWLDAADSSTVTTVSGAVSQWNDKSGNARHVGQATSTLRPSYSASAFNSMPAISYDGSRRQLNQVNGATSITANTISIFFVAEPNATCTTYAESTSGTPTTSGNRLIVTDGSDATSNSQYLVTIASNNFITSEHGASYAPALAVASNASPVKAIYEARLTNKQHTLLKDSLLVRTGQTSTKSSVRITFSGVIIGDGLGWGCFSGLIAEIIYIPNQVSTDTANRIEGYLAHKWGLTANLPAAHPYKTVGPTP